MVRTLGREYPWVHDAERSQDPAPMFRMATREQWLIIRCCHDRPAQGR